MVFYEIEGDIRIELYTELYIEENSITQENLNNKIKTNLVKPIFDLINKHGGIILEDMEISINEQDYSEKIIDENIGDHYEIDGDIIISITAAASDKKINRQLVSIIKKIILNIEKQYDEFVIEDIIFNFDELNYEKCNEE